MGMVTGRRGSCGWAVQLRPSCPRTGGALGTLRVQGWGCSNPTPFSPLHCSAVVETSSRTGWNTQGTTSGISMWGRGGQYCTPSPRDTLGCSDGGGGSTGGEGGQDSPPRSCQWFPLQPLPTHHRNPTWLLALPWASVRALGDSGANTSLMH